MINRNNLIRRSLWGVALMAAYVALCGFGKKQEEQPKPVEERPVRVLTLQGGASGIVRSYPGKTEAKDSVDASFEIAGKIIEFPVKRGQAISQGDVIAKLDARDFENELAAKKSEFDKALTELNRYRELYEKDAVSRQELETKERNKDVTEANMKISEKRVQDATLKAPFSGVVATTYVDNFKSVQAKEPIARIQNNEAIEVVVYVPERDLSVLQTLNLKLAQAVFDAFPKEAFDLKLKEYETQADNVTQTFKVKFTLPSPKGIQVLPGMSATVTLQFEPKAGQEASSVFLVPSSAVMADESGKSFVWVLNESSQTVSRRDVVLGEVAGTEDVKVTGGLEPGMTIVTTGIRELREGMKVRPRAAEEKITE
jgi:membrane fusion protein, multidrug efflux system